MGWLTRCCTCRSDVTCLIWTISRGLPLEFHFIVCWLLWILVSRHCFMLNKMLTGMFVGPGWQNIAKIILLNPKWAKHTEREENTCKHAALHTIINTFWHRRPKAPIIVLILHPLQLPAGNFIFCLLGDFVLRKVLAVAQLDLQSRMKSSNCGRGRGDRDVSEI